MITIVTEIRNPISQDFYDKTIFSLDLALLTCSCGHTGDLIWYGSYSRKVKLSDRTISLRVARVFCKCCNCTHAILLSSIVPYSQIPLDVQAAIAVCCELGMGYHSILDSYLSVDENNISSVVRAYRAHWRERLRSASVCLFPLHLSQLVRQCFSAFSRQFMQIKTTLHQIFPLPT